MPDNKGVSSITVFLRALKPEEGAEVLLCKYKDCIGDECSTPNCDDIVNITEGASAILRYGAAPYSQGICYSPEGEFHYLSNIKWQNPNIDDENIDEEVRAIKVKGNLKAVMFRHVGFDGECEVLKGDYDPDLENNTVKCKGICQGGSVSSLKIIPTGK